MYKRSSDHLVRFSDYHPRHNQEAFFYNILLAKIPFNDEADLLSPENTTGSYMVECMMRDDPDPERMGMKILDSDDDLGDMIEDYYQRHMFK